jgi:hypothetical protein
MICRLCKNEISEPLVLRGVISPWIRELAKVSTRLTKLVICSECSGAAFTVTYDPQTMFKIYSEYRGENYTSIRNKWENWYTTAYNDGHFTQVYVNNRKTSISQFLTSQGVNKVESILDVGGDRGQYIPDFPNLSQKFVLDISNKDLIFGVKRISDLAEISGVDLLIFTHILEHLNDPISEIEKLMSYTKFLYIEVPYGVPNPTKYRKSRIFQAMSLLASASPFVWSGLSRASAGRRTFSKILRQSEHLNFFRPSYFDLIGKKLNLETRVRISTMASPDSTASEVIQVLFCKK